jgi:TolB-like protein/Flp pilus assembly protein TadD
LCRFHQKRKEIRLSGTISFARETDQGYNARSLNPDARLGQPNHAPYRNEQYLEITMGVPKKREKISKRNPSNPPATRGSGTQSSVYEFGPFRVDEAERRVVRNGTPVPLTPKVFDMLLLLIQRSNSLVEKETLLSEIWPNAFVEEANVSVNIATLRKALGEGADSHRYIETVSKRGYRFVAKVRHLKTDKESTRRPRRSSFLRTKTQPVDLEGLEAHNSLAVLPFQNESNDPQAEYLADGLTESLINNLSRLRSLRVVGRNTIFRYKNSRLNPEVIARHLRVRSIVSGRLLQLGDRVIIRTELVDGNDGWQLWGEEFHRQLSDVLTVQHEISEEISKALEFQLTREERNRLKHHYTNNSEAFHLYLKGRYHWNKYSRPGLRTAIDYFTQAIELDPTYALAYAGLADCYYRLSNVYAPTHEAMPKVKAAAMRALEIDPNLSEAHAALGLVKMFYELDWAGAEREFRQAIETNPNYSIAHQRLGLYFNLLGRFDEARQELEIARQLDPLSPQVYGSIGLTFFLAGDYEQALVEMQKTLEMGRNHVPTLYLLGRIYEQTGHSDRAIEFLERAVALDDAPTFVSALGHAYATAGNQQAARKVLTDLKAQSKQRYVSAYTLAIIHLALGEKDQAFSCLEQAYHDRAEMITCLKMDPMFNDIRADLRYSSLLRRLGLDRDYLVLQRRAAS